MSKKPATYLLLLVVLLYHHPRGASKSCNRRFWREQPFILSMIRNSSKLSLPSFDGTPLPILNSLEYGGHNPQLNHLFIDTQYFKEPWHADYFMNVPEECDYKEPWRLKEKMRTSGVALVVCLNIGVDPPDVVKPLQCARRECWFDPTTAPKQKGLEFIGNTLQQQYEKWHSKAKFKQCLDPTAHDLERICVNLRRQVKNDRLLLHYNGHGVPRPTRNGELWVFGKHHTHYMPVSVYELRAWLGEPSIFVLDCSNAGALVPHFLEDLQPQAEFTFNPADEGAREDRAVDNPISPISKSSKKGVEMSQFDSPKMKSPGSKAGKESSLPHSPPKSSTCIVLAACGPDEILPMNPLYPADIFTSCLTTPIPIALRWFILQSPHLSAELNLDMTESIPGKDSDRKTPKGGLNWIFTAIADTIAWSCLPSAVFQNMFRQDLLVASLFRNFLLAQRIMRSFDCTPQCNPHLPDCSTHPLWQAWDAAVEQCLLHVHAMQTGAGPKGAPSSDAPSTAASALLTQRAIQAAQQSGMAFNPPFFNEQLMAFEVWLDFGGPGGSYKDTKEPPVCLPILFQALLSHAHRVKALHLLRRYVALGPQAVHSILAVGVFPYILKLLHNPMVEIRHLLMSIWTYVIGFDSSCRDELVKDIKDKSESRFVQCLRAEDTPYQQRTMAAFIQAEICNGNLVGQQVSLSLHFHRYYSSLLSTPSVIRHPHLKKWIALSLSKLCEDFNPAKRQCIMDNVHLCLYPLLLDSHSAVRMASILSLGEFFGASLVLCPQSLTPGRRLTDEQNDIREKELEIAMQVLESRIDGCAAVRREAMIAISKMVFLPVHYEVIKNVASRFMILAGESELVVPEDDASTSSAYGSPRHSPNRPASAKHFSPSVKSKPSSASRKKKDDAVSNSSGDMDITDSQSDSIVRSIQALIETRLEPAYGSTCKGTSVFGGEDMPPPSRATSSDSMTDMSVSRHLAKSYVNFWRCLLAVQRSDPHPVVVMAAQAVIFRVKVEMTKEILMAEPSDTSIDEIAGSGRRSEGAWLRQDVRDKTGEAINRAGSHDVAGPDGRRNPASPPLYINIPVSGTAPHGEGRRPLSAKFSLEAVNGDFSGKNISEMALVSTVYDWNRKFFLRPDTGYDPADDLLSLEGRERSNRLLMREEVKDLANRIAESFRKIQDQGLTTLMEKDSGEYDEGRNSPSNMSINGGNARASSHEKNGTSASMLPSTLTRFESRGIMRVENADLTSCAMFHAFHDILAATDDKGIGIWSLESGTQIMHIPNSSSSRGGQASVGKGKGGGTTNFTRQKPSQVTSMTWVNESLDSLIMAGCEDGSVKIWRDVGDSAEEGLQKSSEGMGGDLLSTSESSGVVLASAFKALPDITGGSVGSGLVMSWQQRAGLLSAGGNSSTIRLWDVSQEKCVTTFQTGMNSCLTTLISQTTSVRGSSDPHTSWGSGIAGSNPTGFHYDDGGSIFAWSFAGFADGSIGIYDQRVDSRGGRVHSAQEHNSWIVSAHLRADIPEVITGAVSGGIKFWDIRSMKSYKTIEVHKSPLTALSVHNCAPIMATGSQAQFIKILTLAGDQLGMIRYHDGFMGNRIGPVCCLAFHPVRMLMAAGSTDNLLSIYSIPDG